MNYSHTKGSSSSDFQSMESISVVLWIRYSGGLPSIINLGWTARGHGTFSSCHVLSWQLRNIWDNFNDHVHATFWIILCYFHSLVKIFCENSEELIQQRSFNLETTLNWSRISFPLLLYGCVSDMGLYYDTSMRHICEFGNTFHGSLIYLWNTNFPHFSNDLDCGCQVTVDTNVELKIKVWSLSSLNIRCNIHKL